jgi:hypothetical protein
VWHVHLRGLRARAAVRDGLLPVSRSYDDKRGSNVGITCIMRVTLADGSFHEDVGFGAATARGKSEALMQAKKVPRSLRVVLPSLCPSVPRTHHTHAWRHIVCVPCGGLAQSAVTDALKRTMRLFGDGLGNCVSQNKMKSVQELKRAVKATTREGALCLTSVLRSTACSY